MSCSSPALRPPRCSRARRARATRRACAGVLLAAGVVAVVAVVVVGALKDRLVHLESAPVGNSGGRFGSGSSNFRWAWWQQAWRRLAARARLAGTGAGSFHLTNLRYRDSLPRHDDRAAQPAAAVPDSRPASSGSRCSSLAVRRPAAAGAGAAAATSSRSRCFLPAFLVHSLVDVDWDFAAVSAPAFLAAGALAGRPAAARRVAVRGRSPRRVSPLLAFGAAAPAVARRALGERRARRLARRARCSSRSARSRSTRCSSSRSGRRRSPRSSSASRSARSLLRRRRSASSRRTPRPGCCRRATRSQQRCFAVGLHLPRALHRARPEGAAERGRATTTARRCGRSTPATTAARCASARRARSRAARRAGPSGFRPSSGPTTFTCRSRARRRASPR